MTRISVEAAFRWAQQFAIHEKGLLVPVALAFMALPTIAIELASPATSAWMATALIDSRTMAQAMPWLMPLSLAIALLALCGGLALCALAMVPGISVGGAIMLAIRRLWVPAAAMLICVCGLVMAVTLGALLLTVVGIGGARAQALLVIALFIGSTALGARLLPLPVLVVHRSIGPLAALRASWRLTSGQFWRLLGSVILYVVTSLVVLLALRSALGAVILLLARALGVPQVGMALMAVIASIGNAIVWGFFYVLVAGIYRQLTASSRGI